MGKLLVDAGLIVCAAFISPYRADRDRIRAIMPPGRFIEVVKTAWPRDRDSRVLSNEHFGAVTGRLWGHLREESMRALGYSQTISPTE